MLAAGQGSRVQNHYKHTFFFHTETEKCGKYQIVEPLKHSVEPPEAQDNSLFTSMVGRQRMISVFYNFRIKIQNHAKKPKGKTEGRNSQGIKL